MISASIAQIPQISRLRAGHAMATLFSENSRFVSPALSFTLAVLLLASYNLSTGAAAADQGACGPAVQKTCQASESRCCSGSGGYCGDTVEYCGVGCQVEWSAPGACTSNEPAAPFVGERCGSQNGGKECSNNMCCSRAGFCGKTGAYCYEGCQSQCRHKPGVIVGIVFGALGGFGLLCALGYLLFRVYRKHESHKPLSTQPNIQSVHPLFPNESASGKQNTDACLDIVFCHGFGIGDLERDAWRRTWLALDNDDVCWPRDWLGNDLNGKARVFSLEYDGNVYSDHSGHNEDVSEIARNLLQRIFDEPHGIGQTNAVVLIGHSFGGLVIKSLVVEALGQRIARKDIYSKAHAAKCQNFLKNIRGFVFYAVPHSGSENLERYIEMCDRVYRRWHRQNQPAALLRNIKEFSLSMDDLSRKFEAFVRPQGDRQDDLIIYAFTEAMSMTRENQGVVVQHASAVRFSGENYFKIEAANHMTVCRPKTKNDDSYGKLLQVLNHIIETEIDAGYRLNVAPLSPDRFESNMELTPLYGGSLLPR